MDPDVALENILTGRYVVDHVMALSTWLAQHGFAPKERTIPDDCAAFVAHHCAKHYPRLKRADVRVRADKVGIWTAPPDGQWVCLGIWNDLLGVDN